jgi:DNA repair exonuclease SbcCD ATPase subunit
MQPTNNQKASPAAAQSAAKGAEQDGGDLPGGDNIDRIRDIIFGTQMRDYERRFARLEERLLKESSELREDIKQRFDQLDRYTRNEVDALSERLKSEHNTRGAALNELTHELRELAKSTETRTMQLDEHATKNVSELRQQLLDQAQQLSEDLRARFDDLAAIVEHEASELRTNKTDRAALAALFTEMATRLTNDPARRSK